MGTNSYITKLKAQLDQAIIQREHWKQLVHSGGFAFHVAGEFPGLNLAFWAIRG